MFHMQERQLSLSSLFKRPIYNAVRRFPCCFFSVRDSLGTALPRILEFCTNIKYDLLYCVRENKHPHAYLSLCLYIFLSF